MNFKALILAASALVATPLLAQSAPSLDSRVGRVEKQLKAVQRKVFPNGEPIEPETAPVATTPDGAPVQSPIADLTSRVDAIEKSLAALTGTSLPDPAVAIWTLFATVVGVNEMNEAENFACRLELATS